MIGRWAATGSVSRSTGCRLKDKDLGQINEEQWDVLAQNCVTMSTKPSNWICIVHFYSHGPDSVFLFLQQMLRFYASRSPEIHLSRITAQMLVILVEQGLNEAELAVTHVDKLGAPMQL